MCLHWTLEAITDGIAFVRNPRQDLLTADALGRRFYAPVIGDGGRPPNLARFQFLDPASRDFYPDWDLFAEMCVAIASPHALSEYFMTTVSGPHSDPLRVITNTVSLPRPPSNSG